MDGKIRVAVAVVLARGESQNRRLTAKAYPPDLG